MNRLSNSLDTLLAFHECVIIPSFGAIMKHYIAPHYRREEGVVYPGEETLHFNKELRERDGLLDTLYAKNYGLSIRRARLMVDQDVEELQRALSHSGNATISHVGKFQLIENGAIDFFPDKTNLKTASGNAYGLVPIVLPFVKKRDKALAQNTPSVRNIAPIQMEDERYFHLRLSKKAVSWAAAAVIILLCALPITTRPVSNYFSAGFVPSVQIVDPINTTKESNENSLPIASSVEEQAIEEKVILSEMTTTTSSGDYLVVIGSFRTEEKTRSFISACKDASFSSTIGFVQKGNKKMIYAVRKQSVEEAQQFIRSLCSSDPAYKEAWILHYTGEKMK